MKKKVVFFTLLAVVSSTQMVYAQWGVGHGDYHFGYVSASVGYSSLSQSVANVSTKGAWTELFGAGYEFRMHNAWVSVGAQYLQERSTTTPDEYVYNTPCGGLDDQNERVQYYRYTIRQTDKQDWRTIDIPIMAGYYNNGFYCGAGIKAGFSVGSTITTSGEFDLAAKYEKYVGILENIPGTYYQTYPVAEKKYACELRPQFSLIGEIGYDLLSSMQTNSRVCHMLKIGFYFEYGLRSVRPLDSLDPIQIEDMNIIAASEARADVTNAHMTPYYLSKMTEGERIVPYYVGVKLTYLIGGGWNSTATWHKGCQCYGN